MNQKMPDLPPNSKELLQAIKLQQKLGWDQFACGQISRLSKTANTALYSKKKTKTKQLVISSNYTSLGVQSFPMAT
jgi:hypothetical protein